MIDSLHNITIGAAGVTTLNVLPTDSQYSAIGTLIVTLFTVFMQYLKYRDSKKSNKKSVE
tara:strand:- start:8776 stop:8955 length:180 start_codon:yes stop_codon:yes gene_type:complete